MPDGQLLYLNFIENLSFTCLYPGLYKPIVKVAIVFVLLMFGWRCNIACMNAKLCVEKQIILQRDVTYLIFHGSDNYL